MVANKHKDLESESVFTKEALELHKRTYEYPGSVVGHSSLEPPPNRAVALLRNAIHGNSLIGNSKLLLCEEPFLASSIRFGKVGQQNEGAKGEHEVDGSDDDVKPLHRVSLAASPQ
jgi:hypothetical protein